VADPRHSLGLAAEAAVATWLAASGWTILARRVRSRAGGEVDIVARDPSGVLVAVEVRARRTRRAGAAALSVDHLRVHRLRRTLAEVAATASFAHAGLRVDLVTVEPDIAPGRWRVSRLPAVG
jgi:putative endonuclease